MQAEDRYTTQLQAGLGMFQESVSLLRLWEDGDTAGKLAQKAVNDGVFSRATARRTLNIVKEMFGPRFLRDEGQTARSLKILAEKTGSTEDLLQLFFLQTARAQRIFRDFVTDVYWVRYAAGATRITRAEAEAFVERALDTGRTQKRWSHASVKRVSGYLIGCCADFGMVDNSGRNERTIRRFAIRPGVAMYLAHDLHFSGMSDLAITHHPDWALFGLDQHDVLSQIRSLGNDGHLIVQATPELVQIKWKYCSMEEVVRAIS